MDINLGPALERYRAEHAHIKGWGIDADPRNDPTYPMRKRERDPHAGYSWQRPSQQPLDVEVHHSIERPNVTAVFGATLPPRGLSGRIRRLAFRYSEDTYAHWLGLLLADRVNMVEGLVEDLRGGHVPNLYRERGLGADWKYRRGPLLAKAALGVGAAILALHCLRNARRRHEDY